MSLIIVVEHLEKVLISLPLNHHQFLLYSIENHQIIILQKLADSLDMQIVKKFTQLTLLFQEETQDSILLYILQLNVEKLHSLMINGLVEKMLNQLERILIQLIKTLKEVNLLNKKQQLQINLQVIKKKNWKQKLLNLKLKLKN